MDESDLVLITAVVLAGGFILWKATGSAKRRASLALLGLSAASLFFPGGLMNTVRAVENAERAKGENDSVGHLCYECSRPATRSATYSMEGSSTKNVIYFCDEHNPPPRLRASSAHQSFRYGFRWLFFSIIVFLHLAALVNLVNASRVPKESEMLWIPLRLNAGYWLYLTH